MISVATSINKKHYDEWRESAVSSRIIELNVSTIEDARVIDKILGRNTNRRWKHSTDLVPAWCVSGVDPLTGENTLAGVQIKPDTTPIGKDGKPNKYLNAAGTEASPLFLNVGIEGYWESVIRDITKPIIITEGAKKAGAGLSLGYATISIPGVSSCRKNGRLHHLLELFAQLGRTFYLCFDNDILYKRAVQYGLTGLSAQLAKNGSNILVVKLPQGDAKGMDDFISMHGGEAFEEILKNAVTFKEWKDEISELEADENDKPKSKIARNYEMINEAWGDSLRYNSLKKEIEFNGMPLNAEYLKLMVGLQFPVDISKDDAFTIIEFIARRNTYSPVTEYLDECESKYPNIDTSFLDGLAKQFFGTDDPLHAKYFKNFLVASVARARNPGCWMDCALLLVGKQGIRKSTFWRTLYGDDFFSDDLGDGSDKDERMKMHRFWCLEWSEFETVYKRKDIAQLKAFLARRYETFRTPYDRLPKDYKRACVFAGTTNETEILNDPSGNRRFWIIAVMLDMIPIDDVLKMRDRIWAAANALYKSGYSYRLDTHEEVRREEINEEYEVTHPWTDIMARFISNRDYFTVQEVYKELGIEPVHQNPNNQRQITHILKKLGCEPDRVKVMGKWVRIWREKSSHSKNDFSAGSAGSNENIEPETITNQDVQAAPGEDSSMDQSDMIHTQNQIPDPTEDNNNKITVSQADSNTSSHFDPADPAENTFNIGERFPLDSWVITSSGTTGKVVGYVGTSHIELGDSGGDVIGAFHINQVVSCDKPKPVVSNPPKPSCQEFKRAVYGCLSSEEQQAIKQMKQPAPKKPVKAINLPILEVGQEYFSAINQQMVRVVSIQDGLEVCDCELNGKRIVCDFGDLRAIPTSQTLAVDLNDGVEILVGKYKGKKATISSQLCEHGPLFLKIEGVRASVSSKFKFWGHQLKARTVGY
jgi:predicted P-loop ATPase